jgi:hypothetical protein
LPSALKARLKPDTTYLTDPAGAAGSLQFDVDLIAPTTLRQVSPKLE